MITNGAFESPNVHSPHLSGWTPARFLLVGGIILMVLGLSGAIGVLSSLSSAGLFNPPYWIDWVHVSVGVAAATVALAGNASLQRAVTFLPAVLGTVLGVFGMAFSLFTRGPQSADLSDHIAHLCVGTMASWALWRTRSPV